MAPESRDRAVADGQCRDAGGHVCYGFHFSSLGGSTQGCVRFAALTNRIAAAARPATAVRRIGNRLGGSFSTDGLVMIDMVISLSRCLSVVGTSRLDASQWNVS